MKIVSITDKPKTGDADEVLVVFAQGECEPVRKTLRHSGAAQLCGWPPEWGTQLVVKAREAEQGFAFQIFGADWKQYVTRGAYWRGELTADEQRLIEQAKAMRPDLFAAKETA